MTTAALPLPRASDSVMPTPARLPSVSAGLKVRPYKAADVLERGTPVQRIGKSIPVVPAIRVGAVGVVLRATGDGRHLVQFEGSPLPRFSPTNLLAPWSGEAPEPAAPRTLSP